MGRLIHWHWHTIKQLTAASLFRVLLLWTWPFRASKIFIIVFRVQAAVKLSQLEGNLSNSLDFFIHSISPHWQSLFHPLHHSLPVFIQSLHFFLHSVRVPKRFYSTFYSTNFDPAIIKLVSTSFDSFSITAFSTRFLRIFLHPVLLTKVVILTPDTPDSDEWPRRYGIQQHPFTVTSLNRTPLFFCIVSFCGRFYCLGALLRPLIRAIPTDGRDTVQ
jgi:hypothetical protein